METLLTALLLTAGCQVPPEPCLEEEGRPIGTLWRAYHEEKGPIPFLPQEGDLILFSSIQIKYTISYPMVRSFHPWHSGVVVRRSSGELAFFEDGGQSNEFATLRPLEERLTSAYRKAKKERIWIRKIRRPLTPEESCRLTAFAEGVWNRPFSKNRRLAIMLLPGRPLAQTSPNQDNWFCSEIVAQALVSAGIIDSEGVRPQALTPRDLLRDKRVDLSFDWSPIYIFSPDSNPPPPGPPLARP